MPEENKEKGFNRTDIHIPKTLCYNYVREIYKSFDVQSWVGGIGIRTGLKNQRSTQDLAGSKFLTKFQYPAHLILI